MKNIKLTTLLSAMALGLAACGGGSDSNSGTLNVLLTDNPLPVVSTMFMSPLMKCVYTAVLALKIPMQVGPALN